ncbi:MAG TPA: heat-inducible transcriptional repressor HrcA [Pyrinomonadaceae bacterium]|jgi:heat-inducible transcriptional repressor|nr:heat-inducible transcriptional repressor HrcA [Pyrinomonadaceae bacterium]
MTNRSSAFQTLTTTIPDSRGQAILSAIIREHLVTGEPVGSRTISDRFAHASGWSSATIRNVMGELEESGLVEQPHTSAGRVPTDKGYRFYVDHMLGESRLSKADLTAINEMLGTSQFDGGSAPDRLMEKTSHVLSALSENVGIVVSPSLADNRLQHIEFTHLSDNRILVVLVSAPNIIYNKIIRVEDELSQEELERTARYLNTEFGGKSLVAIRAEILELMREEKALYDKLLMNAMLLCNRSLEGEEASTGEVYVDGASNILSKPEFAHAERMRELFRMFEEKSRLIKILNECVARDQLFPGEVQVIIGREHQTPSMQNCSLITAPYRIGSGEVVGTIGVVGPMRMEYARMMTVVNHVARLIERMLREESSHS